MEALLDHDREDLMKKMEESAQVDHVEFTSISISTLTSNLSVHPLITLKNRRISSQFQKEQPLMMTMKKTTKMMKKQRLNPPETVLIKKRRKRNKNGEHQLKKYSISILCYGATAHPFNAIDSKRDIVI